MQNENIKTIVETMKNPMAEESVIGTLIVQPEMIEQVNIKAEDFTDPHLRRLFSLIQDEGSSDMVFLSERLSRDSNGRSDTDTTLKFIYGLADSAVGSESFARNVKIIADRSVDRKMLAFSAEIKALSQRDAGAEEKMSLLASLVDKIESGVSTSDRGARTIFDAAKEFVDSASNPEEKPMGIQTGYDELDELIVSMMPGDLIIVGGRPGMGKTAFAMGVAEKVAKMGKRVGVFSMEMPDIQLAMRMLSGHSGVSGKAMRSGEFTSHELAALSSSAEHLKQFPIVIDDKPGLTLQEVIYRAKKMAKEGLDVLIVDYLQLMVKSDPRVPTRDHVSACSGAMKALAKELGIRVIALAQLSRDLEKRVDKRPVPSDLRESGSIEQDADSIWFVYRDEVYHKDTLEPGIAELIVAKNRAGPVGTARLGFIGEGSRFVNLNPSDAYAQHEDYETL